MSTETGFYSLKATLPGNKTYDFADLKGKTVLIVNTASNWYVLRLWVVLFVAHKGFAVGLHPNIKVQFLCRRRRGNRI